MNSKNMTVVSAAKVPQSHAHHRTQTWVRCQITDALECPSLFLQLPLS